MSESGYANCLHKCAHVEQAVTALLPAFLRSFNPQETHCAGAEAEECDETKENYLCLKCHKVFCGRWKNAHMIQHEELLGESHHHSIACGLSDLSFWCYECDSYLNHEKILEIWQVYAQLHQAKFGEPPSNATDVTPISAVDTTTQHQEGKTPETEEVPIATVVAAVVEVEEGKEAEEEEKQTEDEVLSDNDNDKKQDTALDSKQFASLAEKIKNGTIKKIIVMTGAGISVSAGIPDFRSPKTGLYANLQKYNLPTPESMFHIDFFKSTPEPFCTLAKEMYPGSFKPTDAHWFIRLLEEKGCLLRNYTQNIDGLEYEAKSDPELILQAHGGFNSAHCIECQKEHTKEFVKEIIFADGIPRCSGADCTGLVKPDITFFGEDLPPRFYQLHKQDFAQCDLLIVMGTSLKVNPFASLIKQVGRYVPRVLINLEPAGVSDSAQILQQVEQQLLMIRLQYGQLPANEMVNIRQSLFEAFSGGFQFEDPDSRDLFCQSTCDAGVNAFAEALGWTQELNAIKSSAAAAATPSSSSS
jgi:NAD-dependent SIR2 family protein deacetylase